jgi:L-amino acid N-acyltransferase YncA
MPVAGSLSVEVDPARRDAGLGRALAVAARHLLPFGTSVWAQIAPPNAASVRAFLAAGFKPVGAEAHLTHQELGV